MFLCLPVLHTLEIANDKAVSRAFKTLKHKNMLQDSKLYLILDAGNAGTPWSDVFLLAGLSL